MINFKINSFCTENIKFFGENRIVDIKNLLKNTDELSIDKISLLEFKDPELMLILSIFLGNLGIDRFFIKDYLFGLIKLLTFGGFGILYLIDIFLISNATKEKNYKKLINNLNINFLSDRTI